MRIPKVYGKSRIEHCPFCGKIATQKNDSGLLVCPQHVNAQLEEIRCTCGSWLEQRSGKFGPYFNCLKCGNINFKRGMEMKALMMNSQRTSSVKSFSENDPYENKREEPVKKQPKEITISTNDVEYFD